MRAVQGRADAAMAPSAKIAPVSLLSVYCGSAVGSADEWLYEWLPAPRFGLRGAHMTLRMPPGSIGGTPGCTQAQPRAHKMVSLYYARLQPPRPPSPPVIASSRPLMVEPSPSVHA